MTMKPLITPTVNPNGTDAESLIRDRTKIMSALREAMDTILHAMPHGRDYFDHDRPTSTIARMEVTSRAQDAFRERVNLLRDLYGEFQADALAIQKQQRDRRRA